MEESLEELKAGRRVVCEMKAWLVLEFRKDYFVAFHKGGRMDYRSLFSRFGAYEFRKEARGIPCFSRYHIHLCKG